MLLYNLAIRGYSAAIKAAARFNPKAHQWVEGRRGLLPRITEAMRANQHPVIWVHCASLGEFEQGRPVIESLKTRFPEHKIFLTFFSPSGYEVRKNYAHADWVFYLPADTPANAHDFVAAVRPSLAIFVKYEFWFNYMRTLSHSKVPVNVISAIFREGHPFFKWYGFWFRKQLSVISQFYVQNEDSADTLRRHGINRVVVSGDTRFDRVQAVAAQSFSHPVVEAFVEKHRVLVAGSTWPPDEQLIVALMKNAPADVKLLIAPHEVNEQAIQELTRSLGPRTIRLSKTTTTAAQQARAMIVDSVGMLSQLYRYGDFAYIGGGFGAGTHNILEAATFGLPLFFGPNHQKFRETIDLIRLRGAFPVSTVSCFLSIFEKVATDDFIYQQAHKACLDYIARNTGATGVIISGLEKELNSTGQIITA